jgi:hypothetical protein
MLIEHHAVMLDRPAPAPGRQVLKFGIGRIAGMARQGFDLQLTRYDERGWRATFYTTGMEHSPTSAIGTGRERRLGTRRRGRRGRS